MSSSTVKWGGVAGVIAAALLILSAVLDQLAPSEGIVDTPVEYFSRGAVVLAYVGVIVAVLGISALHRGNRRYGKVGMAASVITIAGYAIIALITLISMVQDFEYLLTVRIGAASLILLGSILLGAIIIRARVLPWWCGVLLIIAFPLGDVANAIFGSAENLLLALLWGSMGFALMSRRHNVAQPSTPQAVQL